MRFLLFTVLCAFVGTLAKAEPIKLVIDVSDSNGGSFRAHIVFVGDLAFEYGPVLTASPDATFELVSDSWIEGDSGTRITLAQAQEWAEASRIKARASLDRVTDPGQRAFAEELLSPSFVISKAPGRLHLKSRFLGYSASEPLEIPTTIRRQIFAFDVLNAFRKAMVLRQTPPFVQLEVTRVLREEAFLPGLLVTDITTPNGSVRVTIRYSISSLTPEEKEKLPNRTAQPTTGS